MSDPDWLPPGYKLCPKCQGELLEILYGKPTTEAIAAAERGEIVLGGGGVSEGGPRFQCKSCGRRYRA